MDLEGPRIADGISSSDNATLFVETKNFLGSNATSDDTLLRGHNWGDFERWWSRSGGGGRGWIERETLPPREIGFW